MSTFNYQLKISYDGFGYEGWQVQAEGHKTVQGELNKALLKVSKGKNASSLGSGRTDSGVHALAQIAKVKIPFKIDSSALQRALNSHLPKDIRILACETSTESFHPVRDALWKRYTYLISIDDVLPPHLRNYVTTYSKEIDWDLVKQAIKRFEGEHDFINFSTKGTIVNTTVRTVYLTQLEKIPAQDSPASSENLELFKLSFEGSGFLKQMVRLLVGTAIAAGQNKIKLNQINEYLEAEYEQKLAPVAPAQGLYLDHVEYQLKHSMTH